MAKRKSTRKKPELTEDQKATARQTLEKVKQLKERIERFPETPENSQERYYDLRYANRLVKRFESGDWFFLPPYKMKTLNDIWKKYK